MQPKNAVLTIIIITILLLAACRPIPSANPPKDTATVAPSTTPTDLPLPTETAMPSITATPQDDLITQNCLDVLPAAPANFTTKGIIPLQDYNTLRTVFLNLETGNTTKIPAVERRIDSFAVSPDQKTLAYKLYEDGSVLLIRRDAMNNNHKVILVRQDDFAFDGWVNNQQLLLGKDYGKLVISNPYTHQEKSYSVEDFPNFDTDDVHNYWVKFDSTATRAIYYHGYTFLLNMESKQIIAKIMYRYDRAPSPEWTLDGSKAAIVGATQLGQYLSESGDDIFSVSRDGQVTQLTHLAEHYGEGFTIHSLSWSPDSRYIAFWMWYPGVKSNNWVLAVLDISTKQVTDYCIPTDPYANTDPYPLVLAVYPPFWSPDGKQIIVEHRTEDSKYVVLVDITQNIAFKIAQNMSPLGWMLVDK